MEESIKIRLALLDAIAHYAKYNVELPQQLNIQKYTNDEGTNIWEAELMSKEDAFLKCTTWLTGYENIVEHLNDVESFADSVLEIWDESWTEYL